MKTLVLLLAGPMQSWGSRSRFTRRETEDMPTKSGIVGLLAAAQGRRRSDPIEDLARIRLGVRVDQPGVLGRDFQTAINYKGDSMPLTERFYLADAKFTAYVESDNDELIEGLAETLARPKYPLYLGRRAFVPSAQIVQGVHDGDALKLMETIPWLASAHEKRQRKFMASVALRVQVDEVMAPVDANGLQRVVSRSIDDSPISFDMEHRRYQARNVIEFSVNVSNNEYVERTGATEPTNDQFMMAVREA